jgi:hypothetical protein
MFQSLNNLPYLSRVSIYARREQDLERYQRWFPLRDERIFPMPARFDEIYLEGKKIVLIVIIPVVLLQLFYHGQSLASTLCLCLIAKLW